VRTIQVRPSRNPRWQKQGGWEVFEADGVSPVYCGEGARESALSYARQRAGHGRAEIQVLDESGNVADTISNEDSRPLV
jgi:diaminopimelate epimerase